MRTSHLALALVAASPAFSQNSSNVVPDLSPLLGNPAVAELATAIAGVAGGLPKQRVVGRSHGNHAVNASAYVPGLLQALGNAGLTQLATVLQNVANTTTGQELFAGLPSGNHTVFAPNNHAFTGTPPSNITDPNELAAILSYHVVSGTFPASDVIAAPAHAILRTGLNASQFVALEGNESQVLVVNNDNGTIRVLNQNTAVKVVSATSYQNLIIHVTDAVIDLPPSLPLAIGSNNLSMFAAAAQQAGLLAPLEASHGVTVFAPTDAAFTAALAALGGASNVNQSTLLAVLGNHVINGTSVYSTELTAANYTSAGGEPFAFSANSSGTYVASGASTARIAVSDVVVANGVVHVLDGVLLNAQSNAQAASSAVASATSVAAQSTGETGAVGGGSPTSSGASASSSGQGQNGAVGLGLPVGPWGVVLAIVLGGAALVV